MGEWDLMSLAFRLDLGLYYLGIVSQPFKYGERALLVPPFSVPMSRPVFHLMRAYNRRLAQIARRRRRANALGKTNRGRRCLIPGFTLKGGDVLGLVGALGTWSAPAELTEGWHTPGVNRRLPAAAGGSPARFTLDTAPSPGGIGVRPASRGFTLKLWNPIIRT